MKFSDLPEVMFLQVIRCLHCGQEMEANVPALPIGQCTVRHLDTPCPKCRNVVRATRWHDGDYDFDKA